MPVRVAALSHHSAPVEIRERLAFPTTASVRRALESLHARFPQSECVLLSTCNRTELYLAHADSILLADIVRALLDAHDDAIHTTKLVNDWLLHFEEKRGHRAIERLFRIAAGLESMMLGEMDIVRQVKEAYAVASDAGTVGGVLNPLFHEALRVGKRARTETELGRGAFGIGHAAADVAQSIFGNLAGRSVLLLGAGAMSEATARHLSTLGVATIFVANRTFDRAVLLAESLGGRAVRYDEFPNYLAQADIVIAGTAAPHPIVTTEMVAPILKQRGRNRPLYLIDIAVPRDIEVGVGELDNVFLYNIDHFEGVVEADNAERRREADKAERIVREEAVAFAAKLRTTETAAPLVSAVRQKMDEAGQSELVRLRKKLAHLPESDWQAIEAFARSLQNKIAHAPSVKIREYAREESWHKIETVRELFALNDAVTVDAQRHGKEDETTS